MSRQASAACWAALAIPCVRVTRSERAASARAGRHRRERRLVQTRAKSAPGARKDDRAQAGLAPQPLARGDDRFEHRAIERVQLVGAIEPDVGDAAGDFDQNAVAQWRQAPAITRRSRFSQRERVADLAFEVNRAGLRLRRHASYPGKRISDSLILETLVEARQAIGNAVIPRAPHLTSPRKRLGEETAGAGVAARFKLQGAGVIGRDWPIKERTCVYSSRFASTKRVFRGGSTPEFNYLNVLPSDLLHDREGEVGDGVGAAHHGVLTALGQRLHPLGNIGVEFGDRDRAVV